MNQALCDHRDPAQLRHAQEELLRKKLFAIPIGYEDFNDHNTLRYDPGLKSAIGCLPVTGEALASQPTLSRLENRVSHAELRRLSDTLMQAYLAAHSERERVRYTIGLITNDCTANHRDKCAQRHPCRK